MAPTEGTTTMQNINVRRYENTSHGYAATIEPEDRSWIVFVDVDNKPTLYAHRDETGASVGEGEVLE